MIIAIDGNEANIEKRVGVNKFAFELIWSIYRLKPKNSYFLIFLNQPSLKDLPPETSWWQYQVFGPKFFWTWTGLAKRLFFGQPRPDVLFSPSHYGPKFSPIPYVVSIMDLGFLRWPDQFTKKDFLQLKMWTEMSAQKAAGIITISNFSKNDISDTYKINPAKIKVVYPGIKELRIKNLELRIMIKKLKREYNINDDYLLYLGTLKPSKNIEGLIRAYNILVSKYPNIQLVIAGKKGWLYNRVFKLVESLNLKNKVVFTGFVSDQEKEILLASAKALVLPSFWEGFGIPVLEAMSLGTPVVCSRAASLPEVGGEAVIYINDPKSVEEIYNALLKMVKLSNKDRQLLIDKGFSQAKKFSWQKAGATTLEFLQEIGG